MRPTTPGSGPAGNRPTAGLADQALPQGAPKTKLAQPAPTSLIETGKGRAIEPYAFPRLVFGELLLAENMDGIDKLLSQAVKGIISQVLTVNRLDAGGFA